MGKASKAGGKTTKGGKTMNPTDAYRKELRKKELTRNKKERKKVREVGILKKDPETLKDQIQKLEAMKADGALDKARKHKKRQLEDTLNLVMKKRKEYEEKMKEKGEAPVMFSHLGPVRRRTTAEEERAKHPILEDSVYYHPTLNPSGAPPPGKPPIFKSSIGPRIPLPEASGSNVASSSMTELDDGTLTMPPLPPPHTPLPSAGSDSGDGFTMPTSLQLPPPPPMPLIPAMTVGAALPPPPPPPPGPPPKELFAVLPPFAPLPPPPVYHSTQLFHPGSTGSEKLTRLDDSTSRYSVQVPNLPPPPTPAGLTQKMDNNLQDGSSSEPDTRLPVDAKDFIKMAPPPPPVSQQPPAPAVSVGPNLLPDILPPGIPHLPPPPPPPLTEMRPLLPHPGIPGHSIPPGVMLPVLPQRLFGPPPGYMMRPPLPLGPPPIPQDEIIGRPPFVPLKPSYVKSAASTVIKRPLAQHTPELTAMVPASVQVRRESAAPKTKPKSSTILPTYKPEVARPARKLQLTSSSFTQKPPSIDDSYSAFLEDMKALGALDS